MIRINIQPWLYWGKLRRVLVCLLVGVQMNALGASDMDLVMERLNEHNRANNIGGASSVAGWLTAMKADGSWPDINYSSTAATSWPPANHLRRLLTMAAAFQTSSSEWYQDSGLGAAIQGGLDYWTTRKPRSGNWWWNDIGGPEPLSAMLLLMKGQLNPDSVAAALQLLSAEPSLTGQNRVWISNVVIHRALVEDNADRLLAGVNGVKSTLAIDPSVGIQVDGSFYQHGNLIYNGGYGLAFLVDVCIWSALLRGTEYAFTGEAGDNLATLILDGTGWMTYNGNIDWSCMGREIARTGQFDKSRQLTEPLGYMIAAADPYQERYQSLLNHIQLRDEANPYETGFRHFWRADYSVLRGAGYMVSLNTFSVRTVGGEVINDENLKGLFLPFGTTFIYRKGNEYDNLMPVWDWRRLPGTTIEQKSTILANGIGMGQSSFVGGVSNGSFGMSAFDQAHAATSVTAHKSWFFFENGFMALGADIRNSNQLPVYTSVEQCRKPLRTIDVRYNGTTGTLPSGDNYLPATEWLIGNGVGYIFPDQDTVFVRSGQQSGSWGSINNLYSQSQTTASVLSIGFEHGDVSQEPASYSYIVLPIGDKEAIQSFAADNPLKVLSNTAELQAIRHEAAGVSGLAFYSPGTLELSPGLNLTAQSPSLVLVAEQDGGDSLEISVADPTALLNEVVLELGGHLSGPNAVFDEARSVTRLTFTLPEGMYAGSTVTSTFTVSKDYDADQIPDRWELAHFSGLYRDGAEDFDRDGFSDNAEFIAGTSPIDRLDHPRLRFLPGQSGQLRLSFSSNTAWTGGLARHHAVEVSGGFTSTNWTSLPGFGNLSALDGDISIPLDSFENQLYRLKTWLE